MEFLGFILVTTVVIVLAVFLALGVSWLIANFAVLPLVDSIWGIELPMWPTVFFIWFLFWLFGAIGRTATNN
jgi:hypothetical protein